MWLVCKPNSLRGLYGGVARVWLTGNCNGPDTPPLSTCTAHNIHGTTDKRELTTLRYAWTEVLQIKLFWMGFPETSVWHVQTAESDHCCLLINFLQSGSSRREETKPFRYENMWRRDESFDKLVRSSWGDGAPTQNLNELQARLSGLQDSLQVWERNIFGSVRKNLVKLRRELENIRSRSIGMGPSRAERRIMAKISELLTREEIMEKQRSRLDWLKDADRNTNFFQAKAKERKRSN